ncbi:DMT family transporter [Amycolatopsis sp. NPDC059090]|uniref:DMT family transporter n=1 Tax=Amycolatopsis sp. NPDC059090 TaxID=3346723 RepID=UPI00366C1CFA
MAKTIPQDERSNRRTPALVVITMVLWASAFVAIRYESGRFAPGSLALGRLLVGSIALGTILLRRGEGVPARAAWPGIAGLGVFWFAAYAVTLNWGEEYTDAGSASLVVGIGPILVALLAGWLLKEGFPLRLFAGLVVAFGGLVAVGLSCGNGTASLRGILLCLLAACAFSAGTVSQKFALRHASALQVTAFGCAVGAVACLPFAGQLSRDLGAAPIGATLTMLYLGLMPTAVAFYTWACALAKTTAGKLSAATYLVQVLVVMLSWILLREVPGPLTLVGGAVCMAGVALSRRTRTT